MSYHTKFVGQFDLDRPLTLEQFNLLNDFSEADHRHDELSGLPNFWCDWVPAKDGKSIKWNGWDGSFYDYTEWIEFLIEKFLVPWGYTLNGKVAWQGEEVGDHGTILVSANEVSTEADTTLEKVGASVSNLIVQGLYAEGAGHKQWYLWQISKALGMELKVDAEPGVAP
jgi:hypothetical protein